MVNKGNVPTVVVDAIDIRIREARVKGDTGCRDADAEWCWFTGLIIATHTYTD